MKLRSTLGALAVAGALTVGAATPAVAEPPADPPSRACVAARHALHELRLVNRHVNREIRRIEAAIARATDAGNTDLAARLQAQLDRLEARQDQVQARVATIRDRVQDRCGPVEEPTT